MKARCGVLAFVLLSLIPATNAYCIINGVVDTDHPAVGVVMDDFGMMGSAVLIDPHWVLTSASLASAMTGASFRVGADFAAPDAVYAIAATYCHPAYNPETGVNDIALIRLSSAVAGITPIPYLTSAPALGVGAQVQYVGFGVTAPYDASNTLRHSCWNPVVSLSATNFDTEYSGAGPYLGDSGGPALFAVGGVQQVAGIISLIAEGGTGFAVSTRVSAYVSFIQTVMTENPPVTAVDPGVPAPRRLSLAPNPFNPKTTIRFELPAAGSVRLAVYDVAGRLVRVLVEGERPAGTHEAAWDGRDRFGRAAPSGSYLARLVAGGRVEVVRMGLVR